MKFILSLAMGVIFVMAWYVVCLSLNLILPVYYFGCMLIGIGMYYYVKRLEKL